MNVVFSKQSWFISEIPRERKHGNIWPLLLLTADYGVQAASPGQRVFSGFPWEVEHHQYTCTVLLRGFCKGKALVSNNKII